MNTPIPINNKYTGGQFMNTAMMDEDYITVGSHVDEITLNKIKRSEYIDFGKLIPKDRVLVEEENRMELIFKGGHSYYVSSFRHKWDKWIQQMGTGIQGVFKYIHKILPSSIIGAYWV